MQECTALCCPLVQIRQFRHDPRQRSASEEWVAHQRRLRQVTTREGTRWRGYRKPLPLKYRSTAATDRVDHCRRWDGNPETGYARDIHPSAVMDPTRTVRQESDSTIKGEFANDEHRGVCEWPPIGILRQARTAARLWQDRWDGRAGTLDLDGLTTTASGCHLPESVFLSVSDRQRLARARAAWTREWGHQRTPEAMTDREMAAYHAGIEARRLCGTHAAIFERPGASPEIALERLAVPMRCGQRMCDTCFQLSREVAGERLKGNWRQFLTLTIPSGPTGMLHAWRSMSGWASKMMSAMRRVARRRDGRCKCGRHPRTAFPGTCRTADGSLGFGWVIEPHKSYWPHLHVCLTSDFFCYHWLRKTWARITRSGARVIKMKPVYDRNGVCRYLVKYLTKAAFPDHLLAVLYRKRLWGRSETPSRTKSAGWSMVEIAKIPRSEEGPELIALEPSKWKSAVPVGNRAWKITGELNGRWIHWVLTTEERNGWEDGSLRNQTLQALRGKGNKGERPQYDTEETSGDVGGDVLEKRSVDRGYPEKGAGRIGECLELDRKGSWRVARFGADPEAVG